MDDMVLEKRNDRTFILMPREWLKEAECIERYELRIANYRNVPMTTGAGYLSGEGKPHELKAKEDSLP